MIVIFIGLAALIGLVWYFSTRATAFYGAFLAGYFTAQFDAHWITIGIAALAGAGAVFGLLFLLAILSHKWPWLALVQIALICAPPFLIGYNMLYGFMTDPSQGASPIEGGLAGLLAGIVTACAAYSAYQRDMAAMIDN